MRGIFITFEGPDGAGKTTQLELLTQYLRRKGFSVRCTREPGGTSLGDNIRSILLDADNHGAISDRAEALLYMAARAQHVAELILPALLRGEIVLSDRFSDSTVVYQGAARQLKREDLRMINRFATAGVTPHLTVLLDADVMSLQSRVTNRGRQDRIELEGREFQEKVRQGFLDLATGDPDRIKIVNAIGDSEAIHQNITRLVDEYLQRRACNED